MSNNAPSSSNTVTVRFLSPDGTPTNVTVPAGTTVDVLLSQRNIDPSTVTTRVNRVEASPSTVLREGDQVSAVSSKVAGA